MIKVWQSKLLWLQITNALVNQALEQFSMSKGHFCQATEAKSSKTVFYKQIHDKLLNCDYFLEISFNIQSSN